MHRFMNHRLRTAVCLIALVAGAAAPRAFADAPATQPSSLTIAPDVQSELDAINAAYGKLKSLTLAGTLDFNAIVDEQPRKESSPLTSSFLAPIKFRHDMKDDLLAGCTGEKSFVYFPAQNLYLQVDAPKSKADFSKSRSKVVKALEKQNPGLLMALSDNPSKSLLDEATSVTKGSEKLGDQTFTTLAMQMPDNDVTVLIDPATHYIRQFRIDLAKEMKARGADNVKNAMITFDYTSILPDAPLKPEEFAWSPPDGAKDAAAERNDATAAANAALLGKPAPNFSLMTFDDQKVSLADLKGSVVVLDFWATYCVPCRISLPEWSKFYEEKKSAGLKVFAINLKEPKPLVARFLEKVKLKMPILLDSEGEMGTAYQIQPIPETVLIGKDGIVKKVIVSADPEDTETMRQAIEEELKK